MKNRKLITLIALFATLMLVLVACGGGNENATNVPEETENVAEETENVVEEPTEEPAEEATAVVEEVAGVSCAEPVKVGLITDETGPLAIYGAHMLRSFPLGMEYATGDRKSVV